jgi:SAM-dependent methyltransferase
MSGLAARFFACLQGAAFYREVHEQAVALLPQGAGRTWLDLGCGPGLVARLAAARGYHARGRDIDRHMIAMAQRIAQQTGSRAAFETAGIDAPPQDGGADVVSAASLLIVLDDRTVALRQMLAQLKQDGVLLLVETTPAMRPRAAWRWLKQAGHTKRGWLLMLWAWVRSGRAIHPNELGVEGWHTECTELMGGLVAAWTIRRRGAAHTRSATAAS